MTKYWLRVGDVLLAVEMHDLPPVAAALVSATTWSSTRRARLLRDVARHADRGPESLTIAGRARARLPLPVRGADISTSVCSRCSSTRGSISCTGMARAPRPTPTCALVPESFRYWRDSCAMLQRARSAQIF
jgi:hypothetical protein